MYAYSISHRVFRRRRRNYVSIASSSSWFVYLLILTIHSTSCSLDYESSSSSNNGSAMLVDGEGVSHESSRFANYGESIEVDGGVNEREQYNEFGVGSLESVENQITNNVSFQRFVAENAEESISSSPKPEVVSQNITTILNTLLQNYDKRLRPNYGGPPVVVSVTIYVSTISAVSEVEMDYTIDMYLRQYWYDARLAFTGINESLTIGIDMVKNIWVPDTFFPNEKKSFFHDATTHNGFLRITPDGQMLRSIRLTVTANCPMNLVYFPMDRQNCSLEIESYGYSTRDIAYTWKGGKDAVDIAPDINLAQFSVTGHESYERQISLSTGNYSRLSAHFTFRRNLGFYLIQIYLPSSLIVIISWVSFWLNREATQARVAIGVTTVLTMTTLMTSTNASMPKVSYVKSIDIYLGTCFVIVFASLLEYAAVGYLMKRVKMKREKAEQRLQTIKALPAMMFGNASAMAAAAAAAASSTDGSFRATTGGGGGGGPQPPTLPIPFLSAAARAALSPQDVRSPPQQGTPTNPFGPLPPSAHQHENHAGLGLLWNRKPQGYQAIGSPYEMHAYQMSGKSYLEQNPPPNPPEAALACDCDMDIIASLQEMGEDLPPGVSSEPSNGRGRFRGGRRRNMSREKGFKPSTIDKYSRIFFPLSFVVFHLIYWIVYLYTADANAIGHFS